MRPALPVAVALLVATAPAVAQPVYKCTTPTGAVTYQETPCATQGAQKRVDTSAGGGTDPVARRLLEREAYRGDPLARGFVDEIRERERRERLEREERLRRERPKETRPADEPWVTPWGWAGPPGLARPKPKSGS